VNSSPATTSSEGFRADVKKALLDLNDDYDLPGVPSDTAREARETDQATLTGPPTCGAGFCSTALIADVGQLNSVPHAHVPSRYDSHRPPHAGLLTWHRRHVDCGIRLCGFRTLGRLSWRPRSHFSSRVDRSSLKPKTTLSVLVFWKEGKMKTKVTTLAALISSVLLSSVQAVAAQTNPPPSATATRPAKTPPEEASVPNASPPATTTQTTGENSRDPTVKKMNEDEKKKVDTTGK
jgi:hypothetical protein